VTVVSTAVVRVVDCSDDGKTYTWLCVDHPRDAHRQSYCRTVDR
jgi:hypothetical protein